MGINTNCDDSHLDDDECVVIMVNSYNPRQRWAHRYNDERMIEEMIEDDNSMLLDSNLESWLLLFYTISKWMICLFQDCTTGNCRQAKNDKEILKKRQKNEKMINQ